MVTAGPGTVLQRSAALTPAHLGHRRGRVVVNAVLQRERPSSPSPPPRQNNSYGVLAGSERTLAREKARLNVLLQESPKQQEPTGQQPGTSVSSKQEHVVYFAYGANMNFYTLQRRDVKVLSRDAAFVRDPAVHLMFKHRGGYATLARLPPGQLPKYQPLGSKVNGVLYKVTKEDFRKLEKREGGYTTQEFEVETYDGSVFTAVAFVSSPMASLPEEVVPTEKYMALLREGAADNYLDPFYQAWLSSIVTVPSVGLPSEYYNTPAKYVSYGFLLICSCIAAGFFFQ